MPSGFYKFNPKTLSFEKAKLGFRHIAKRMVWVFLSGIAFALIFIWIGFYVIDSPKEKLLEHNLCISEVMLTARDMNKTTFVERICYHDKDKVLFNCQGQTLTLKDVEKVEPPKGMNFSYVFDNGYSYYGADVTTKEKWLSGISSIISRGPIVVGYKSGYRGCLNGVIDVTFTKESYHVVSNS